MSLLMLRISTEPAELDLDLIHRFLALESYWARGISRTVLEQAIAHSLCFGGYLGSEQVAFARVVTDRATFGHLKDVFVTTPHRGRGIGLQLMRAVMAHPDLGAVTFTLGTADAHTLYQRFGFLRPSEPGRLMIRPGTFLNPERPL